MSRQTTGLGFVYSLTNEPSTMLSQHWKSRAQQHRPRVPHDTSTSRFMEKTMNKSRSSQERPIGEDKRKFIHFQTPLVLPPAYSILVGWDKWCPAKAQEPLGQPQQKFLRTLSMIQGGPDCSPVTPCQRRVSYSHSQGEASVSSSQDVESCKQHRQLQLEGAAQEACQLLPPREPGRSWASL